MFQVHVSGTSDVTVRFVGALTAGCRAAVSRVLHDAGWRAASMVIDLTEVSRLDDECGDVIRQAAEADHVRLIVDLGLPAQRGGVGGTPLVIRRGA